MPRGFGRLPFLSRRHADDERSGGDAPAVSQRPVDLETAAVGPPALLPSMILRQVLFDASEFTPAWARPRPQAPPEPVAASEAPKTTKRPRRTKASTAGADAGGSTPAPRRSRKANRSSTSGA